MSLQQVRCLHHASLPAVHGDPGGRDVNASCRGGSCREELLGERSPSDELRLADNIGERVTRGWISLARRVLQSDHVLPPRSQGTGKGKVARSSRVRPVLGGSTDRWTLPTYQYVRRARRVCSGTMGSERVAMRGWSRLTVREVSVLRRSRFPDFTTWDRICKLYGLAADVRGGT
jgi:hypothetical protein